MTKSFSIEAIFSAKDRLTSVIGKVSGKLAGLGKVGNQALGGLNRLVDKGLGGIGKFSNAIGIGGVASLAGLGFEFVNVMQHGAEFEKMLVRTGSAFDKPVRTGTAGFAALTAAARLVGTTTEFSAQQGAEGLNALATAGYSVEQSIGALPKIIDFASAASLELSQSSDIASDTLGAFNLRTADATQNTANMARIMDTMTRAAADSTTTVAELFEGIRMGGAFAATSGASIEQFVAMQGVLANKGIKGAEAGVAIRNSFLHLTKQTTEAKNTMAGLGISIARTKDGSVDMIGTIARFTKATSKLTKAQKAEAIATVFGAYTVGPFLSLMNSGADTIADFQKNLERATGTTATMAATMRDSTAAKIAKFFNIIEDVRLTVFEAVAPTVLNIAESIGKWVSANKELIGTKAGEWATTLKDALPDIAKWTERIAVAVAGFTVFALVIKSITGIVTLVGWLSTAFAWLEITALLLGTTVGALAWPVLLIGAAIAAVVAIAWKYWPEISGFFSKLAAWAIDAVGGMWTWIVGAFGTAKDWIVGAFEFIVGLGSLIFAGPIAAAQWFVGVMRVAFGTAVDWIRQKFAPLTQWFSDLWASVVGAFNVAWSGWMGAWGEITSVFESVWKGISDGFDKYIGPIIAGVSSLIATIRTVGRMTLGTADSEGGAVPTVRPGEGVQVVTPQARAASATAEAVVGESAKVDGTITVRAEPGTKASAKTRRGTIPLAVQPSGAL